MNYYTTAVLDPQEYNSSLHQKLWEIRELATIDANIVN